MADFELGIKKQIPEVVKEIFTPAEIEDYKALFNLYDYDEQGLINMALVPKILTRAQHEYKPLDLQMAMQEIDDSKGQEIDEMIFLQLAAKCYRPSWSKKEVLKAFNILNQPKKRPIIGSALLQYYMTEIGEPLTLSELKTFMSLANPDRHTGEILYKDLIKLLGAIVPRKHEKSRIKKEIAMKAPKISDVIQKISLRKKKETLGVKKSKSLDMLLKSIDLLSNKSSSDTLHKYDDDYFSISEIDEVEED